MQLRTAHTHHISECGEGEVRSQESSEKTSRNKAEGVGRIMSGLEKPTRVIKPRVLYQKGGSVNYSNRSNPDFHNADEHTEHGIISPAVRLFWLDVVA